MRASRMLFLSPLLLASLSWAGSYDCSNASACRITCSGSSDDVAFTGALTSATAGSTITVSGASCAFSGAVSVAKSISLKADGAVSWTGNPGESGSSASWSGSTTLTGTNPFFSVNVGSGNNIRISGFKFYQNGQQIRVSGTSTTALVLDNNYFDAINCNAGSTSGAQLLIEQGSLSSRGMYGVVSKNVFHNGYVDAYVIGPDNWEWQKAYNTGAVRAGTSEALFFEANYFKTDNSCTNSDPDANVYIQEGQASVVRYNTFDASTFSAGKLSVANHHGNQEYNDGFSNQFRGQILSEWYHNYVTAYAPEGTNGSVAGFRGGSVLLYDNTIVVSHNGGTHWYNMIEEEGYQSAFFSPLRTSWPGQDQIFNTFVWGNTYNGSRDNTYTCGGGSGGCTNFVKKDRDYFEHAPCSSAASQDAFGNTCTHGYEYFTGSRYGGSTASPSTGDTGSMSFSATGNNAYYPYTPYTYPHPLTVGTLPAPPTGLSGTVK